MNHATEPSHPPPPVAELIASLKQASVMAKQLPATVDQAHLLEIYYSLHQAHHHLSSVLSSLPHPQPPIPTASVAAVNSLSSATGFGDDGIEPMQTGEEEDGEADENLAVEKMEKRMRECFIKNKRAKRPLSPSAAAVAEDRRVYEDGCVGESKGGFDPHRAKLRALDLVYQFHG